MHQFISKLQMENKIREKEKNEAHKQLQKKEEEITSLKAKLAEAEGKKSEEEINVKGMVNRASCGGCVDSPKTRRWRVEIIHIQDTFVSNFPSPRHQNKLTVISATAMFVIHSLHVSTGAMAVAGSIIVSPKSDFWKVERQNSKNVGKDTGVPPLNPVPVPAPQTPSIDHNQTLVPNPIRACPVTSTYVVPNIVNQDRSSFLSSRNKYQPGLVSQQLTRASSCTIPGSRVHHSYDLATPRYRPVFKRTASDVFAPTANPYSYSSYYRGNYRNNFTPASQPNIVNTPVTFSPRSNTPFDLPTNSKLSGDV
ncbi:uncharacterized protein LOC110944497 [Helianthus annuus]|uniref:uncharacterized protein LOC110944497 n=1 Tax=Helianthus annuus TaxID=4232 RepID=UPI000B8F3BE8|nr:uncharacterized protein LOC110944497 [Helianthus annuus]